MRGNPISALSNGNLQDLRLQGQDEAMEETRTDPPAEVTDVLIKRGFKRAAIVGMATGSSTVFQGAVTMGVDTSSTPAAVVGAVLIVVGVVVTAVSAAGYRKYTAYRARQVDAVMARARRLARGEGGAPALLDLGSGGELLRVMAPCDLLTCGALVNGASSCREMAAPPSRKGSVDILAVAKAAARRGSADNLSVQVTDASFGPNVRRGGDAPPGNRRQGGSTGNLLDDGSTPPTIELCPGMVVVPVYLEEWSSTVEVYMPDEHEAPPWLYSDMLLLFWLAVLLASLGHMMLNAAFIVLGAAFHTRPSLTVDVLCGVLGSVGGLCVVGAGGAARRCHIIYQNYLRQDAASSLDDTSLFKRPALWQLL
ncbi:uncharacterized protein LOC123511184 [Portunus trituberculatus]|uniref:uncharacterized protein LOC123511184 n=1 Tax=Portunus trituberculatus TaxID=210409 RepID=UPI001E1CD1A4|nr:uncharacterized protein LOC123511184 [Portunus trituberculatus]